MIDLLLATTDPDAASLEAAREFAQRTVFGPLGLGFLVLAVCLFIALPVVLLVLSSRLRSIARNTFFESIRQPVMLVLLIIGTLALVLSNPLATFTMENDQRMLLDIGIATVFLCGALLAAFIATNVLGREIENKTALTVVSKPVGRPLFVLGKFIGVAGALLLGAVYLGLVFLLVEQHGVLQTVRDPIHVPVVVFGTAAGVVGLGAGVWCNYFYGKVFSSTVIVITTPLAGVAYVLSLNFGPDFTIEPMSSNFDLNLWLALVAVMMGILLLSAVAVAASTRLGQVMTLSVTLAVFVAGMLSDHFLGRPIKDIEQVWLERARQRELTHTEEQERIIAIKGEAIDVVLEEVEVATVPLTRMAEGTETASYRALQGAYALVPNFQVMLLSDALTQQHRIPPAYVGRAVGYGTCQIVAVLSLAVILFQRREVG